MKIRNVFNYNHDIERGEVNTLPSMTVPDGTMTVREIFDRYARGSFLPMKEELWDDDPEMELPDIHHMDLADRSALQESASIEIDQIKNRKDDKKAKDVPGEQSPKNDGEGENAGTSSSF